MIERNMAKKLEQALAQFPAVALLGPRQVGKSTLARLFAEKLGDSHARFLDLERSSDLAQIQEPELYLRANEGKLVILDEIQLVPNLFSALKSIIDERRTRGMRTGQFLLLGSASIDLLRQSAETLAGRILYLHLTGFTLDEVGAQSPDNNSKILDTLWLRGGFPDSFLAQGDGESGVWRDAFIRTYLERDIPALGPRIPAETLRRFWTMLAHSQGAPKNAARFAAGLGISGQTVSRYIDLLSDLLLVRVLPPWHANAGKRMVKSPKIYVRDSGLAHTLLGITTLEDLLSHPVVGGSFEGFVIEQILASAPPEVRASYYRASSGSEVDLVLEHGIRRVAIEIKRTLSPKLSPGFVHACEDMRVTERYFVYPGDNRFPLDGKTDALPLKSLMELLSKW